VTTSIRRYSENKREVASSVIGFRNIIRKLQIKLTIMNIKISINIKFLLTSMKILYNAKISTIAKIISFSNERHIG